MTSFFLNPCGFETKQGSLTLGTSPRRFNPRYHAQKCPSSAKFSQARINAYPSQSMRLKPIFKRQRLLAFLIPIRERVQRFIIMQNFERQRQL
jgi:hypothetical protein